MPDNAPQNEVGPDTQQERWVKYGANVAVTVVLVIAIVVAAVMVTQRVDKRVDTTTSGEFSLKPQTLNIVRDLSVPVKLVSLYTKATAADRQNDATDYAGAVADLLEEYKRSGRNVEVEFIDPQAQPDKSNDLLNEVTARYGGEVDKYKAFLGGRSKVFADVKAFAKAEAAALPPFDPMAKSGMDGQIALVSQSLVGVPDDVDAAEQSVTKALTPKVPDYKVAATAYVREAHDLSEQFGGIGDFCQQLSAAPAAAVSPALKKWAADAAPRYVAERAKVDAVDADEKKLGDLKLDEVKQKVKELDAILVMGPKDMRTLSFGQVWRPETDKKLLAGLSEDAAKKKRNFLGEQQVTGAILGVTAAHKPRVAFVRPGGQPLTATGSLSQRPGLLSRFADRLRVYNFDVVEKDASGQSAMEAMQQGGPPTPEPTEAELAEATWVVVDFPQQQRQQMPGMPPPPSPLDPMLAKHLAAGGSAVVLTMPGADKLATALDPWGVEALTDLVAVHDLVKSDGSAASSNYINDLLKLPFFWSVTSYGDSKVTAPVRSLDTLLYECAPVTTSARPGYTVGSLLPLPQTLSGWGSHDQEAAMSGEAVKFDKAAGDLPGPSLGGSPLFAGATVQSAKGGRLVVIGSLPAATDTVVALRDPDLAARNISAARFPGNAEVMANSVFWAAHLDQLIAISPGAMEVSRIGPMSDGVLRFWRVGFLLVGLPGLVVAAGVGVYFLRRA